MSATGLIVAAPASGSGKTLVTMGLLRCLAKRGIVVAPVKIGPDYIDPAFHTLAAGRECLNLDSWAMRPDTLTRMVSGLRGDLVLAEGVMGLFDGAAVDDRLDAGSTAELAVLTGWPVVLVVNARGQGASVGALLHGFVSMRADVTVAGVILNNVGSARHTQILTRAAAAAVPGMVVLGALAHDDSLHIPSRHLGLRQAEEQGGLELLLERLAARVGTDVDLDGLLRLAKPSHMAQTAVDGIPLAPLGQIVAVARDTAFSFIYPHVLDGWRRAGAEVKFFSPLADEPPSADADSVYLPGGYPELHAGQLAGNERFMAGLRKAATLGAAVYGECGGYMVLGRSLADADGQPHAMAGLLPLEASFAQRKRRLGYRDVTLLADIPLGRAGSRFRGHEFHYSSTSDEGPGMALFEVTDADGRSLAAAGLRDGSVAGSFVHLIDAAGAVP